MKARLPGIADLIDTLDTQDQLHPLVAQAANGDRVDAYTHNGRIAIVRARTWRTPITLKVAAIHKTIAHLVPQQVFGKNQWRQKLNDWKNDSRWFRDFVTDFANTAEGQAYHPSELAEEAVAFHAQKILNEPGYKAAERVPPVRREAARVAPLRRRRPQAARCAEAAGVFRPDLAAFLARSENIARRAAENRRKGDARPSFAKSQGVDRRTWRIRSGPSREEPGRAAYGSGPSGASEPRAQPGGPRGHGRVRAEPSRRRAAEGGGLAGGGERIALEPGALKRLTEKGRPAHAGGGLRREAPDFRRRLASFKDPSRLDTLIRPGQIRGVRSQRSARTPARTGRCTVACGQAPPVHHGGSRRGLPGVVVKKLLLGEMEKATALDWRNCATGYRAPSDAPSLTSRSG